MIIQARGINGTWHVKEVTLGSWQLAKSGQIRQEGGQPSWRQARSGRRRRHMWQKRRARAGTRWEMKLRQGRGWVRSLLHEDTFISEQIGNRRLCLLWGFQELRPGETGVWAMRSKPFSQNPGELNLLDHGVGLKSTHRSESPKLLFLMPGVKITSLY